MWLLSPGDGERKGAADNLGPGAERGPPPQAGTQGSSTPRRADLESWARPAPREAWCPCGICSPFPLLTCV